MVYAASTDYISLPEEFRCEVVRQKQEWLSNKIDSRQRNKLKYFIVNFCETAFWLVVLQGGPGSRKFVLFTEKRQLLGLQVSLQRGEKHFSVSRTGRQTDGLTDILAG